MGVSLVQNQKRQIRVWLNLVCRSMSSRRLLADCSEEEIDRLRNRYKRYYRWHRQVFTDLLLGKFTDEASFRQALRVARIEASAAGKTSAPPVEKLRRTTPASFGRTNDRKFIKLAVRILYLRMTAGEYHWRGHHYEPWPLPCDDDQTMTPTDAREKLEEIFKPWAIGYDAIRKTHTPFQDDK